MPIYLGPIDHLALILYTIYLGGVLGGGWMLWRFSGKQKLWGLAVLLESSAAAVLLTLMSSKYWFTGAEGVISVAVGPLVAAVITVSLPLIIGAVVVIAAAFFSILLIRRNYRTAGILLPCILIPVIFATSTNQLLAITERNKPVAQDSNLEIKIVPGFNITPFRKEPASNPTAIIVGPDNNLYVANYNGDIWGISTTDGTSWRYATGFRVPVGLAWHENELFVASHGKVSVVHDTDGDHVGDSVDDIVTGLPARLYPWHANNGLVFGPDGRIYFAVGSTSDRSIETYEYAATVLSANPDGSDLRTFATGVRNPYRLAFNSQGDLFATDNGPDGLDATPGDELNHVVEGGDYGFPQEFGFPPPGSESKAPIALFPPHASADGLIFYQDDVFPTEYFDNAFVALWHLGEIYRLQLTKLENGTYAPQTSLFVTGLNAPLDLAVGPDGSMYVIDFNDSVIYKITYTGEN